MHSVVAQAHGGKPGPGPGDPNDVPLSAGDVRRNVAPGAPAWQSREPYPVLSGLFRAWLAQPAEWTNRPDPLLRGVVLDAIEEAPPPDPVLFGTYKPLHDTLYHCVYAGWCGRAKPQRRERARTTGGFPMMFGRYPLFVPAPRGVLGHPVGMYYFWPEVEADPDFDALKAPGWWSARYEPRPEPAPRRRRRQGARA